MKKFSKRFLAAALLCALAPHALVAQSMEMTSAKLYIQQNEWDKAIDFLQKAVSKKPDNAEAHYLLAQGYGMKGRLAEMLTALAAVQQYDKKSKYAKDAGNIRQKYFAENFNNGVKAFNEQNFDAAAEKFATAALLDPSQEASFQNLTIAYRQVDRDLANGTPCESCPAELEWDAAATLCRDKATGVAVKFCCCPEAKEQMEAAIVKTYQAMMKMQPDSLSNYLALSDYYKGKSQLEKSTALLTEANAKFPNNTKVLGEMAVAYDYMGKSEEAFKTYEQALASKPEDKDLRFNFGRLYLLRAEAAAKKEPVEHAAVIAAYGDAIVQFKQVLDLEPEDYESNYNVGVSYLKIGEDHDKQIREMDEAATKKKQKIDDAKAEALRNKGKEHFTAALPFLEKAVELKPDQAPVWFNLGVGYTRAGASEKAKAAFAKAEELEKSGN